MHKISPPRGPQHTWILAPGRPSDKDNGLHAPTQLRLARPHATLYGKSPELISEPIKFGKNPSFLTADMDRIFREIAWKAVVEHPLSGVTDKNRNGIGDHLE